MLAHRHSLVPVVFRRHCKAACHPQNCKDMAPGTEHTVVHLNTAGCSTPADHFRVVALQLNLGLTFLGNSRGACCVCGGVETLHVHTYRPKGAHGPLMRLFLC